ncbi:MAG: hypothetical protein ABS944_14460 [Solibacillus sp.]|uniref:hypothetical protein n=1 Tax=unclassified Solibacillus TaxID=2637870 RepID=UPI0030FAAB78
MGNLNSKFAHLVPEQIKEIQQLEEKLEVTLLAYDIFSNENHGQQENNSDAINPS